ncbi:hypothetical protein Tco_1203805 [Tanacetum coccineum]
MVGTSEKRNMNKFCDYHQDQGHNTNDCYHLKKQIEEAVASGRLVHLVKDIRVRRIHVDGGSSSEVIYEHCFRNLSYRTRSRLKESRVPLVGFSREVSYPLRVINLEVTMGECGKTQTVIMEFAVVKSPSSYNALLGRMGMRSLGVVASTIHSMIKFPTSNRIATIATTRETLEECRQIEEAQSLKRRQLDKGRKPPKSGVEEKIVNIDVFAWTPSDMTGIPRAITEHSLDTYPHIEPKAQKKRSLTPDRRKVVTDEVNEWLKAGATYQRLVNSAFKEQIGVNLEAYVDDMVIKSRTE